MARTERRRGQSASRRRTTGAGATEQPERVAPATPRPAANQPLRAAPRKRSPFSFLKRFRPRFAADIISELRKVTWPTFAEARYLTFVVAVVALSVGVLLGLVDLGFGWLIEQLFFN